MGCVLWSTDYTEKSHRQKEGHRHHGRNRDYHQPIITTTLKENLQMTLLKTLHRLHMFSWSDHTIKYQRPTFPLSPPPAFLSRQNTKINEVGLFWPVLTKRTIFRGHIKEWKPESVTLCFLVHHKRNRDYILVMTL